MNSAIVLVHGAARGSWCWDKVVAPLRERGSIVHAPTLSGLADRRHLLSPGLGLQTHVMDVCALLEAHELAGVTLVGHSYGAVVVAGVVGAMGDRVARVVLLDGPIANDGESGAGLHPLGHTFADRAITVDGTRVIPSAFRPDPRLTSQDNDWMSRRVTPQPLRCTLDSVSMPNQWPAALDKHYVRCLPAAGNPPQYLERVDPERGWTYHELESHHDVMVARPEWLIDFLVGLSDQHPIVDAPPRKTGRAAQLS